VFMSEANPFFNDIEHCRENPVLYSPNFIASAEEDSAFVASDWRLCILDPVAPAAAKAK
jgi:hypothetical protein